MSKLTAPSLDDTILSVTENIVNTIPKEALNTIPESQREEFLADMSDAVELVMRDHLSVGLAEILVPADA